MFAALPFYVYDQTGSAFASGAVLTALTLPGLLFGTVAGDLAGIVPLLIVSAVRYCAAGLLVPVLLGRLQAGTQEGQTRQVGRDKKSRPSE